jgi:prolyl oligopeptidase PreP (S9A serine peptidase family)
MRIYYSFKLSSINRMTAEEIRDVGYLQWKDPWAWMETMKGKRWENLITKEKQHFHSLASQPIVHKKSQEMQKELTDVSQYLVIPGFSMGGGSIHIIYHPSARFYWKWSWKKQCKPAMDIDVQQQYVWYTLPDKHSPYKINLICEDSSGHTLWKKTNISGSIAIIDQYCYYIKVEDGLKAGALCVCDALTGKREHIIYRETNEEKYLNIYKCANRTLYLESEYPLGNQIWKIQGLHLIPLFKKALLDLPYGRIINSNEDCVLTRNSHNEPWKAHGKPISEWILPDEEIEWMNIITGNVLTINEGAETIWFCSPHKKPKKIFKINAGVIHINSWEAWEGSINNCAIIKSPFEIPYTIQFVYDTVIKLPIQYKIKDNISFKPLTVHKSYAKSKDGTKVPYITLFEKGIKPKGQFIYVYGSYGSSTPIGWPYQNWYPLIKRKWAIVFAFVRGGGDIDAAWAEAARRENRHVSIDDFEVVIRHSQQRLHLGPDETVIYGRSAGGLPVGAIVARYPSGNLVGCAFTEVPYVDILRTSSNPDLPLTKGEYEEFGNPLKKVMDFKELLSVSPMNSLPNDGAPGVFVMSRVGLIDQQVFAYESFKWIQRLRGYLSPDQSKMSDPKGKYVTFERKEGHVYSARRFPRFRAIDLAILDTWIDKKLKYD